MKHLSWLVLVIIGAGCAASPDVVAAPTRPADSAATSARPVSTTRETFDALAGDVLEKQRVAFEQRNPGWKSMPLPNIGPRFRPTIIAARRDASGARRTISGSEAEAKARAFVHMNATFFDLTPPQAAQLVASASPYPQGLSDAGHALFLVGVRGDIVQPGLEAFPSVKQRVSLALTIFDDGEVGVVVTSSSDVPELHLRTTPKLDARTAAARVVGEPIYEYARVASIPNTYESTWRRTRVASVTADAIRKTTLTIEVAYETDTRRVYFLAYEVLVDQGGVRVAYLVDPDDGSVMKRPAAPGPIVP